MVFPWGAECWGFLGVRGFLGVCLGVGSFDWVAVRGSPFFYAGVSCDVAGMVVRGAWLCKFTTPPHTWAGGEDRAPGELTARFLAGDITAPCTPGWCI